MGIEFLEVGVYVFLEEVNHDTLSAKAEDDIGVVHGNLFFQEVGVVVHVFLQHSVAGGLHVGLFLAVDTCDRCVFVKALETCGVVGLGERNGFSVGDGEKAVDPKFEVGKEFLRGAHGEAWRGDATCLGADVPAVFFIEFFGEHQEAHAGVVPQLFFVGGAVNLAEAVPFHVAAIE